MSIGEQLQNKISKFFKTGEWDIWRDQLCENEVLTEKILKDHISDYQPNDYLNKQLVKGYITQRANYFYQKDYLTKFVFKLYPIEFIKRIKAQRLFEHDFFDDFIEPIKSEGTILNMMEDLVFVQKEIQINNNLKDKIRSKLYEYEFIELLFHLAVWNDEQYLSQIINNQNNITLNPIITQVTSLLIKLKHEIKQAYQDKLSFSPEKLQERFMNFLSCFSENENKRFPFLAILSESMEYIKRNESIDKYLYHNSRLIKQEDGNYVIEPFDPDEDDTWRKCGELLAHLNHFYQIESHNDSFEKYNVSPFSYPVNQSSKVEFYYNGIPDKIQIDEKEINLYEILLFFEGLVSFHRTRYFVNLIQSAEEYPSSNIFKVILGAMHMGNLWPKPMMGPINMTDQDYFIKRVKNKIGFEKDIENDKVRKILEFLPFDLNNELENDFFNILEQPFLKLGNIIHYFTVYITANNPSFIIENRILKLDKKIRKQYEEDVCKNLESVILEIFQKYGFDSLKGIEIFSRNSQPITDIDVLAWKGDELLIVQVKKTYYRVSLKEINSYYDTLEHAAFQIDKSVKYIKENSTDFFKENNIKINSKDFKVYGIVISNSPEGNFRLYGSNKYPKITSSELEILLGDKRYYFDHQNIKNPNSFLWKDNERSINALMEAVESDYLWGDLV